MPQNEFMQTKTMVFHVVLYDLDFIQSIWYGIILKISFIVVTSHTKIH